MSQKYRRIKEYLIQFLREETFKTGLNGGVMALGHDIESVVTAILAKEAFGNRLLVLLTEAESQDDLLRAFCQVRDIRYFTVADSEIKQTYSFLEGADTKRTDAFVSRVRMAVLYDTASRERALVLGAKNKSDLLLGEGTVYGDLACALNPVGDLYRSEVLEFATYLGVDASFRESEHFVRSDKDTTGGYLSEMLDRMLRAFTEERLSREELIAAGYDSEMVDTVIDRIYRNQFKYKGPVIAKLTSRTIGQDLCYPGDIKL
ncbi:MAG: NAD(+) synthase [Sulfurospirillum sp.]|nr:MAG: NAD(+) synthase [Sulfurospirillum sp.]